MCVHMNLIQSIFKQLVITLKIGVCNVDIARGRCMQIYIQVAVRRVAANWLYFL